jgi:Tol biopolymer transport system component
MKRTLLFATTVLAAVWFVSAALGETGNELFQKALVKERSEGNLKEAIKLYQQVVDKYGQDRALAAKALVAMAESQEKLGEAEARKTYERIVREYGDQKDAVTTARARLGDSAGSLNAGIVSRQVWTGPKVDSDGTVSADGRYLSIVDWETGDLALHDLISGKDRRLTNKGSWADSNDYAEESAFSRDGKQVAYAWYSDKNRRYELRLIALGESDTAKPKVLYDNQDVSWIAPSDWSPDGKWIAVNIQRKDRTVQIGLVDSRDGSLRVLKSGDWRRSTKLCFSPDGKYLAYDLPPDQTSQQRDVFVLALDGNHEIPAAVHSANDVVMGWSPDGTRLLFSSDRTASVGLWALPFADGKVQGSPELLKPNIGSNVSLGLTASGALYVEKRFNTSDVTFAPIDLEAGKLLGPPVSFTQGFAEGGANPTWSPDGKYLVYHVTCSNGCVVIRSVATGQARRLAPNLTNARFVRWSPDGRSLLTKGIDQRGRNGIFQIDVQSGQATAVVLSDGLTTFVQWSPDGKKVYFQRNRVFVERDLASGTERDVYYDMGVRNGALSPDGRYLAVARTDPSTKTASLLLVPVAGGQPRELLRLKQSEGLKSVNVWTPDSNAVIITKDTGSRLEIWKVPITRGEPRKLEIDPNLIWPERERFQDVVFSLSPDGHSIAFQMGKAGSEVWALENFLPALKARK